ncbi:MAG: helix-turn-helix transcriptional regulator, partial [Bacillota bacterium]
EVTISVGKVVENINDIYLSFSHAQMLMSKKFIYGKGSIISDDKDGIKTSKEGEDVDIKKALGELYTSVYISNKEEIDRLLGEIALRLASGDSSEDIIKLNYFNIYFAIVNKLNMEEHNMGENLQINETVISDFMEIYKKTSLNELHDYIKCKLISLTEEVSKKRPDCTMKKIIDYINKNYNGDVKLETLAQMFNYNSAYLGKLFKSHTGEYFNTYLDMVRIENAKQMLEDGLKVYQVAERIGYYNINYFISKFKKYVGDSPSSYKKRCK